MPFTDRTLTCKDCGTSFVFSAREQEFYASKGFENDPARWLIFRAAGDEQRARGHQGV